MEITSLDNKLIKKITSLKQKKYRDLYKEFFVEGENSVIEALNSNFTLTNILYCPELFDISKIHTSIEPTSVTREILSKISDTISPQGIIAVCKIPQNYEITTAYSKILFLDTLQDPGNVGTIIRTADAMNFDLVILSKKCADPYSLKVTRSTVGSIFHTPIIYDVDTTQILQELKNKSYTIYSSTPYNAISIDEITPTTPLVLVIGNEGNGISEETKQNTDFFVKIDMPGLAESLNASIAAGILMYKFK